MLVPKDDEKAYKATVGDYAKVETLPNDIVGLGRVRNYVIDRYKEDVVMLDDDIEAIYSMVREKAYRIKNREFVEGVLDMVYQCAVDAGAKLFGIGQSRDIRKAVYTKPFNLKTWVGSIVGVIGKEYKFDEVNKVRVDVDFSLTQLLETRFVWVDERYAFYSKKNNNIGGSSIVRSKEVVEKDKERLKRKWGKYIEIGKGKNTDTVKLLVERTERGLIQ